MEKDLEKFAHDVFYLNPEMIKFLLVENLALKLLLHKQGIVKPEDFAEAKKEAAEVFEKQANQKIEEIRKMHSQNSCEKSSQV
jgi:hypothetical protein